MTGWIGGRVGWLVGLDWVGEFWEEGWLLGRLQSLAVIRLDALRAGVLLFVSLILCV